MDAFAADSPMRSAELTRISQNLNLDHSTKTLASSYFDSAWKQESLKVVSCLRQKYQIASPLGLAGVSVYIASKCVMIPTLSGGQSRGLGIGLLRVIKATFDNSP